MLKKKRWGDFVVVRLYRFILFVITLQWVTKVKLNLWNKICQTIIKKTFVWTFLRGVNQTNVDAKVQINIETAIPKLEKIAQKYVGIINPQGFLQ